MNSIDTRFHRELRKRVLETLTQKSADLCQGTAQSFEDYKNRTGYLRALADVLEFCEDIERALNSNVQAKGTD